MKIIVFSLCYNRADIIPFYLRHYSTFADEISVFDDHSTDGSRELLQAHPKVILRNWPYDTGIDEKRFLQHAREWYPKAHPAFDWVFWVDMDELVYHPDMRTLLWAAHGSDFHVIQPDGYNMMNEGLPRDDGRQLWEICPNGVYAPVYSKPIIFRPTEDMHWSLGKHQLYGDHSIWNTSGAKLLHYRYLGKEYTERRNAENYARCGLKDGDKGPAWSCAPGYKGEHSAEWAGGAVKLAKRVV